MSAFICNREHFLYLAQAAVLSHSHWEIGGFSYYWGGTRHSVSNNDFEGMADIANTLLAENVRSVKARYPGTDSDLPGPVGGVAPFTAADIDLFAWQGHYKPVQVLKSCHCYDYQACETADYETTRAYAIIRAIEKKFMVRIPGYDEAAWGDPASRKVSQTHLRVIA